MKQQTTRKIIIAKYCIAYGRVTKLYNLDGIRNRKSSYFLNTHTSSIANCEEDFISYSSLFMDVNYLLNRSRLDSIQRTHDSHSTTTQLNKQREKMTEYCTYHTFHCNMILVLARVKRDAKAPSSTVQYL